MKYNSRPIYVIDDNGNYKFTIFQINHLIDLDFTTPLSEIPTLKNDIKILNSDKIEKIFYIFKPVEPNFTHKSYTYEIWDDAYGAQNRFYAGSGYNGLINRPQIDELPVVDNTGKCLYLIESGRFFSAIMKFYPKEKAYINYVPQYKISSSKAGFNKYTKKYYSQNGEDGIIIEILKSIGTKSNYCVEFGAGNGSEGANTAEFLLNRGFNGLLIEGDDYRYQNCKKAYDQQTNITIIKGFVKMKGYGAIDDILASNKAPTYIDIMSIDIDGYDYWVWYYMQVRPRVVVIEYNPTIDNDVIFITPKNENIRQASSAAALVFLAQNKGYELVSVTHANLIFVVKEEFEKLGITDNRLEILRPATSCLNNTYFLTHDNKIYYKGINNFVFGGGEYFCSDKFVVAQDG